MKYRVEIDGLRALAVLPVLFFHAGFEFIPGGFFGVDVFFVISGYLITSIIKADIEKDRFSLLLFYERRARRILPALFFVTFSSFILGWHIMLPDEFTAFSHSLIAVNLFYSNIYFWQITADYFSPTTEILPLLHSWSLSVEEQFYILFPLLLLVTRRVRWGVKVGLIGSLSLFSFALTQANLSADPNASFYLTPTRAWELGLGALIPFISTNVRPLFKEYLGAIGLLALLASFLLFQHDMRHPGFITLLPVLGTVLIIVFTDGGTMAGRLLSWKPLVGTGLISYSLYLWHQPLFAFARIWESEPLTLAQSIILLSASFLMAFLSWRWIEQPFRKKEFLNQRGVFASSLGATIASLLLAGAILSHNGFPTRLNDEAQMILQAGGKDFDLWGTCHGRPKNYITPQEACHFNTGHRLQFAIWGDSHATAQFPGLSAYFQKTNADISLHSYSGCPPIRDLSVHLAGNTCDKFNNETFQWLKEHDSIHTIFLAARWTSTYESEIVHPVVEGKTITQSPAREKTLTRSIQILIDELISAGKNIVLIYPVPEAGQPILHQLARNAQSLKNIPASVSTDYTHFKKRSSKSYDYLNSLGTAAGLHRLYPENAFCNTELTARCIISSGTQAFYFDEDHLNRMGSEKLVTAFSHSAVFQSLLRQKGVEAIAESYLNE